MAGAVVRYLPESNGLEFCFVGGKSVSAHPRDLVLATIRQTYFMVRGRAYQLWDDNSDFLGYVADSVRLENGSLGLVLNNSVQLGRPQCVGGVYAPNFQWVQEDPHYPFTIDHDHFDRIINIVVGKKAIIKFLGLPNLSPCRERYIPFVKQMQDSLRRGSGGKR